MLTAVVEGGRTERGRYLQVPGVPQHPSPLNVLIYRLTSLIVVHPPWWTHIVAILPGRIEHFLPKRRPISKKKPTLSSADGQSTLCPAPATPELVRAAIPKPSSAATQSPASEAAAAPYPTSPCEEPNSANPTPSAAGKPSPASEALAAPCPDSPCVEPGTSVDPLLALAMAAAVDIKRAPCLDTFLRGKQQPTLSAPPAGTPHPATGLLQEYATQGCPAEVGAPWPV